MDFRTFAGMQMSFAFCDRLETTGSDLFDSRKAVNI